MLHGFPKWNVAWNFYAHMATPLCSTSWVETSEWRLFPYLTIIDIRLFLLIDHVVMFLGCDLNILDHMVLESTLKRITQQDN